jgi:hypothetical protein
MADSIKKSAIDVLRKYRALEMMVSFNIAMAMAAGVLIFMAYCKPCLERNPVGPPYTVNPQDLPNVPTLVLAAFCLLAGFLSCVVPVPRKNGAGQKIYCVPFLEEYVTTKMETALNGAYATASRDMATEDDKKRFCALARETLDDLAALSWFIRVPKGEKYIFVVGSRPSGAEQLQPVWLEEALEQMKCA